MKFKGRREDDRLLTGQGKYTSDWNLPGQLYAYFLRSDRPHAEIVSIKWSGANPTDRLPKAETYRFLKGTVLNSTGDGLVKLTNPFLAQSTNPLLVQTIELDMRDTQRPRRVSERNETEAAGSNQEVWVDLGWTGGDASAGDFFRPFRTLADGVGAVAAHGEVGIVPGASAERGVLNKGKRLRLSAPIGGVRIGSRPP